VEPQATSVLTVALPFGLRVTDAADALELNWLQLCLMGEVSARGLDGLTDTLANLVHRSA